MRGLAAAFALAFLTTGCGGDDAAVDTPYVEHFKGTYLVRDVTEVIMMAKWDSVTFTVTDGYIYTMRFYPLSTSDQSVDFCGCDGRLDKYTSNTIGFSPNLYLGSNCDTLRVPRGDFTADYATHRPDTVYIEKRLGDSLYQLVVLKN
jgi:hypothetical protein